MLGFITTQEVINTLNSNLLIAFANHGIEPYLKLTGLQLLTGGVFLPVEDIDLVQPCFGVAELKAFPETTSMLDFLGGLEARVSITTEQLAPI